MSNAILTAIADAMHGAIKDPDIDIEGITSAVQSLDPTAVALLFGDEGAISYPHVLHVDGYRWRMEYVDCQHRVVWEPHPPAETLEELVDQLSEEYRTSGLTAEAILEAIEAAAGNGVDAGIDVKAIARRVVHWELAPKVIEEIASRHNLDAA